MKITLESLPFFLNPLISSSVRVAHSVGVTNTWSSPTAPHDYIGTALSELHMQM